MQFVSNDARIVGMTQEHQSYVLAFSTALDIGLGQKINTFHVGIRRAT